MQGLQGWFRTDEQGKDALRERMCLCGRMFEQRQLSERFMEMCERAGKGAVKAVMSDIPDLWVPRNCPSCERRDMTRHAPETFVSPRASVRLADRQRFAENMARLFGAYNRPNDEATVRAYWKALEFSVSDEQFERGVILAIRTEKRWPAAATISDLLKVAA